MVPLVVSGVGFNPSLGRHVTNHLLEKLIILVLVNHHVLHDQLELVDLEVESSGDLLSEMALSLEVGHFNSLFGLVPAINFVITLDLKRL